jgi:hypothetical protein
MVITRCCQQAERDRAAGGGWGCERANPGGAAVAAGSHLEAAGRPILLLPHLLPYPCFQVSIAKSNLFKTTHAIRV